MTNQGNSPPILADELALRLRDGLLQDLLAVSMLLEGAGAGVDEHAAEHARALLRDAHLTVRADIHVVRALITRLRAGDASVCDQPVIAAPDGGVPRRAR